MLFSGVCLHSVNYGFHVVASEERKDLLKCLSEKMPPQVFNNQEEDVKEQQIKNETIKK